MSAFQSPRETSRCHQQQNKRLGIAEDDTSSGSDPVSDLGQLSLLPWTSVCLPENENASWHHLKSYSSSKKSWDLMNNKSTKALRHDQD